MRRRNLLQNKYKHVRYSNDGGQTFTAASQAAIDAAKGSLPLEGRNLLEVSKIKKGDNVSSLTVTNAATNTFNIVIRTAHTKGRIQKILPFATDTAKWVGRKYVLSGYIRTSVDTTVRFDFGDINQKEAAINTTATSTYFTVTFNRTNYLTSPYYGFIDVNFPTALTADISVYFDKLKLEVGSVATAFTETNLINIENAHKNSLVGRNLIIGNPSFLTISAAKSTTYNVMPYAAALVSQKKVMFSADVVGRNLHNDVSGTHYGCDCCFVTITGRRQWNDFTKTTWNYEDPINSRKERLVDLTRIEQIDSMIEKNIFYRGSNTTDVYFSMKNIKMEVGDTATHWTPAPEDCAFGTTEGEYMGTLVWDKPYPSNNPSDYTWNTTGA